MSGRLLPLPEASLATMCGSGRPSGSMSLGSSNFQYATRSLQGMRCCIRMHG